MVGMQFELHPLQTSAVDGWYGQFHASAALFPQGTGHLLKLSTQQAVDAGRFAPPDKIRPRLLTLEFTVRSFLCTVHISHRYIK